MYARTFSLSVRFASHETLAMAWDVEKGTLVLPLRVAPPFGAHAIVDVSVGNRPRLLSGTLVPAPANARFPAALHVVEAEARARLSEILEPARAELAARSEERRAIDVPALVSGKLLARLKDLSDGGARVEFGGGRAPEPGTLVHLTLFPRDAAAIPAPVIARVVWRSPDGASAGVSFVPGAARSVELLLRSGATAARRPAA